MDGLALEPDNLGFTDPLTNIWKPKNIQVILMDQRILSQKLRII